MVVPELEIGSISWMSWTLLLLFFISDFTFSLNGKKMYERRHSKLAFSYHFLGIKCDQHQDISTFVHIL